MYFTFYATEIVGLDIGVVGILIAATKVLEAAFSLMVGFIVDKTNTRFGKGRPYSLFLLPMWLSVIFLFSTPDLSMTGRTIYVFALYCLVNAVFNTLLVGGESAYMSRAITEYRHRAQVTSVSAVLVMLICATGGILMPQLMATWGTQPGGWGKIAIVYGLPMCAVGMLRFFFIKEKDDGTTVNSTIKIKTNLRNVMRNKYIFILAPATALCLLVQTISSIVGTYYFTYIIGDLALMSYAGMIGLASPLLLLLFPAATRTIGGMNFIRIGLALAVIGSLIKLINPSNLALVITSQLLGNLGLTSLLMMGGYFALQCIDYGEQKTGSRAEGLTSAVSGLFGRVAAGLASVLVGTAMGVAGYVNNAAQQIPQAENMIIALYSWIPAVLCAIILVILHFYDLDCKLRKGDFL